jgi:internalin A
LRSVYCLRELLYLYQTSLGDRADFLDRVIVLTVGDTLKFSRASERAAHVLYWQQEEKKLDVILSQLDRISISDADRAEQLAIKDFAHRVSDILSWVADTLMPRSGVSGQESLDAALALFQQRLAQKSAPGATVTKLAEKMRSANS